MRNILIPAVVAIAAFSATAATAQNGTVNGAAGGAVTGAIVGGPIGAAVGGVAGAIVGTAIDPPPREVVTYVRQQPAPAPVLVQQDIIVGKPLPDAVVLTPVPTNERYAYAVVNERRVIVDPRTHTVVEIIE